MVTGNSIEPILGVNTLHYAWDQSSIEGRVIVSILFVFSLVAWGVMASKLLQLKKSQKLNRMFWRSFRKQDDPLAIYDQGLAVDGCPNFNVYMQASEEFSQVLRRGIPETPERPYTPASQKCLESSLESAVATEAEKLESGMVVLALAVSGAPFIGLLGTVWGVMTIFTDVAESGQAQLVNMAPGLSAAMMTTVAGLLVAIPSMFGYNWLIGKSRSLVVDLDNFAQTYSSAILMRYTVNASAQKHKDQTQNELPLERPS